jgi:DNA-binding winged helix-turn-helix (wHTH) protein/Tfp pilus assembly protein PilF
MSAAPTDMSERLPAPESTTAHAFQSSEPNRPSFEPGVRAISRARFAEFEIDVEERRLWRNGRPVKIQRKPFEILCLLLERPGALVTRARIARVLWPDLHVNYERSLNTAMNALREALGESGGSFRFIETSTGNGYRFIAPVEPSCGSVGIPSLEQNPPIDGAHRDYLTGMFFYNKMSEESLTPAMAHFAAAIQQDSSFARAYAGLAQVYNFLAFWGVLVPVESGKRAAEYARSALWLAPDRPESYVAMAGAKRVLDWDWTGAERLYRKALDIDPCCEQARVWFADMLLCQGRVDEAAAQINAALSHDPLSQWAGFQCAWTRLVTGDVRGALEQTWRALVLDPNFALGHLLLGFIYEEMETLDDALTEFENARASSPGNPVFLAALGHGLARSGAREQAFSILRELHALSRRRYVSPYCSAIIHSGLGDATACVAELERAFEARDIHLQWMYVDHRLKLLRSSEKGLGGLLSRMGLRHTAASHA